MPRSLSSSIRWHALAASVALVIFVSLMVLEAGAQAPRRGKRLPLQSTSPTANIPPQVQRKSIASLRSMDTADGSRVTITSDVPLNDYAAYWSGDRYYVVIPDADLTSQNLQALQASLRGRGFRDVKIEKRGQDVLISFRLEPGMRARVEQKFNRLDIVFTAPAGASVYNRNTNNASGRNGSTPNDIITNTQANTQANANVTYTNTNTGASNSGALASAGGGVRGGRRRGGSGYRGGVRYGGGGGGGGGSGVPLNIPLPSEMALPGATPAGSPSTSATPSTSASPAGSPDAALTTASPIAPTTTPEQIAQAQQPPVTGPPTTTTTKTAPPVAPATETGFAAAVRNNWLPLLIGLLVLLAIGLLLVSRSRSREAEAPAAAPLGTRRKESIKEAPRTKVGTALAGGAAAAAAASARAKEAKTAATPAPVVKEERAGKEEVKGIEPVAPAVGAERVTTEVKSLLEGGTYDEAVIGSSNPETRGMVGTELLAGLASRNPERRNHARAAYTKHGFFDEATRTLRTAENPAERISAARSLGLTQDRAATAHLTAALEDEDPEVRRTAVNALAELRDPSAIGPLNALLEREKNRKVPHSLIRRAIEASATIDVTDASRATGAAPTPAVEATAAKPTEAATATGEGKDKDDEDREVFEI